MERFLLSLLLLLTHAVSAQPVVSYGNNAAAGNYATVNGIKMYYEVYGSGQPVLLLHGNGGSIAGRAAQIAQLSKQYKVIAVDSRCHGKTECETGDLDYEMMASDINGLLNQLSVDSAMIWGHSDGAILGLIMAYTYPDKVKRLLATGANLTPDTVAFYPEILDMINIHPKVKDTMMKKHLKLMALHPNIKKEKLMQIKAPVLVMAGDRDAIRNEHTVSIFNHIPNSQLCILPGTTHFITNEKPVLFMQLLTDFFEKPFRMPSTIAIAKRMAQQMIH